MGSRSSPRLNQSATSTSGKSLERIMTQMLPLKERSLALKERSLAFACVIHRLPSVVGMTTALTPWAW